MKERNKLLLPIAAIVLLQLVAVYTLALRLHSELAAQFNRSANVTLDDLAVSVIDRTKRFLQPVRNAVQIGVELMDKGVLDGEDAAALESYFETQLAATPWLSGMFLGRPDGSFVYLARNQFGLRTKTITITDDERIVELVQRDPAGTITERWMDTADEYDPRERSWYLEAQKSDSIAWTQPYLFFSSGLPGISAAATSRHGLTMGVDVELEELSAFIEHIPHAQSGTALIIDSASSVIARSGSGDLHSDIPTDEIPKFVDVAEAPLLALHAASVVDRPNEALVGLDIENSRFLGLARIFPIAEEAESWTLLVQMRADDYAGGALNFFKREIVLLGVISIALGILALTGVLWLHRIGRQVNEDATHDPTSGALYQSVFERLVTQRFAVDQELQNGFCGGVMVLEARGLRRLADRLGTGSRDAVLVEIGRRLRRVLDDEDLLGVSPNGRYLVAVLSDNRAALLQRFESFHESAAEDAMFATPCGAQKLTIASGVAVLENGEPVGNLLPRAREALTLGIEREHSGCQVAVGLDAHRL